MHFFSPFWTIVHYEQHANEALDLASEFSEVTQGFINTLRFMEANVHGDIIYDM